MAAQSRHLERAAQGIKHQQASLKAHVTCNLPGLYLHFSQLDHAALERCCVLPQPIILTLCSTRPSHVCTKGKQAP